MDHFLEGIAPFRQWYINPNENSSKYKPSPLSLRKLPLRHMLNEEIVYVLTAIFHQRSRWLGPTSGESCKPFLFNQIEVKFFLSYRIMKIGHKIIHRSRGPSIVEFRFRQIFDCLWKCHVFFRLWGWTGCNSKYWLVSYFGPLIFFVFFCFAIGCVKPWTIQAVFAKRKLKENKCHILVEILKKIKI